MQKGMIAALLLCTMFSPQSLKKDSVVVLCAAETQYISVNDTVSELKEKPFVYNNVTYLPVRGVAEALGAKIGYSEAKKSITASVGNQEITIDSSGSLNMESRTYLPARKLAEQFGLQVEWYEGLIALSNKGTSLSPSDIAHAKEDLKFTEYTDRKFEYAPDFSKDAGLYTEPVTLTLSSKIKDAVIRYTVDGSEPTASSYLYTGPIKIQDRTWEKNALSDIRTTDENFVPPKSQYFKGTTIKAKAFDKNGNSTATSVHSYFIANDIFERYRVPVISITVPSGSLFDGENGIYVPPNYYNKGSEWERNAYMEVFDTSGNEVVSQTVGLRIHGGFTRIYQQKSMRVYARENVSLKNGGEKKFKYDFFNGKAVDSSGKAIKSYKAILLKNAGDDWYNYFIRDMLCQKIAAPLHVDTIAGQPSVVFINGEYWGVHEIRERYDDNYFKSHYDLADSADVAMVEISDDRDHADLSEGEDSDLQDFKDKFNFVANNDMSVWENYEKACGYFDIDNLIDYYAINVYFENTDWPFNNIKIWKNKNPENKVDGRWRWALSDMDGTFENLRYHVSDTGSAGGAALWRWSRGEAGTLGYLLEDEPCLMQRFMVSMLKNDDFRHKFESRYRECIDNYFSYDAVAPIITDLSEKIKPLRAEHKKRYPTSWNKSSYAELFNYAETRRYSALQEIENYF